MAYVAAHYLKHSLKLQGKVYLVGMAGFGKELQLQGITYTGPGVRSPPFLHTLSCLLLQEDPVPESVADMLETPLDPEVYYDMLPYSSGGNIFVKVVILAISWKNFRGRAVCIKTTPIDSRFFVGKYFVVCLSTTKILPPEKYML